MRYIVADSFSFMGDPAFVCYIPPGTIRCWLKLVDSIGLENMLISMSMYTQIPTSGKLRKSNESNVRNHTY